jgi:hypothetical protein
MINKFYVYELWDPIKNEPFYVGKGTRRRYYNRVEEHLKQAVGRIKIKKGSNGHKINRIRHILSLGSTPIIKIVFETPDEAQAFDKEKELIKLYGRRDLNTGSLTNLTEGGDGQAGRIYTEAQKQKISLRVRGVGNPMFGKTHTPEVKNRISALKKLRPVYKHTEEWKQYLRSGNSSLKRTYLARSKPIYQIDFSGHIIKLWPSASVATKKLGYPTNTNICSCALNKNKELTYKGYYWIYEKDAAVVEGKLLNIDTLNERRLAPKIFKSIIQCDLAGNTIKLWKSALQLKRETGFRNDIISNIIRGKRKSNIYQGYSWKKA